MIKITGWKSKALWSIIGLSEDTHEERTEAFNAAHLLKRDYAVTPCSIRGLCIQSWVEPIIEEDAPKAEDQRTYNQLLKAAIAAFAASMESEFANPHGVHNVDYYIMRLRQLSAV